MHITEPYPYPAQFYKNKLVERGVRMIVAETGITEQEASELLGKLGSVRKVVDFVNNR